MWKTLKRVRAASINQRILTTEFRKSISGTSSSSNLTSYYHEFRDSVSKSSEQCIRRYQIEFGYMGYCTTI
ncbi:unnamed protein product [Rhizophagus irregularis]|nr:unnamed protein product [Rhizophagus irregularis]